MSSESQFDILIVGGGVLGTAIAAKLSQMTAKVCLVEKTGDVAEGATKGNSGVATSFYDKAGSMAEQMTSASYQRWEDICTRLDVPYKRIGALMPAFTQEEEALLMPVFNDASGCGVPAKLLTGQQALELEPMISPDCRAAVFLPAEGIIDPIRLTIAYAELAARNGVSIRFNSPVIGFESEEGRLVAAITPKETIRARYFINAAGLYADNISQLAGGEIFKMWPRKGQYWLLDPEFGAKFKHIIWGVTVPGTGHMGIHIVPTTSRSLLLGPTAKDIEDRHDTSTDKETLSYVFESTKRMAPAVSLDYATKAYASLRPACEEPYFARIDHQVHNLLHVVSRSIGVTTSPALSDYVIDILKTDGMKLEENPSAINRLPEIPKIKHKENPESLDLTKAGTSFSQIVCVCEQVTAGEIEAALKAHVPARSINGIRKRTNATGGRCQGSVCMVGVAFQCAMHMNCSPEKVPQRDDGVDMGVGHENL
jgi:glycerol-3-phosphate dehydrogenase